MKKKREYVVASAWFCRPSKKRDKYQRMADVWQRSAEAVFDDSVKIIRRDAEPPNFDDPCPVFNRGNRLIGPGKTLAWRDKIRHWNDILQNTPVGIPILMTDIDVCFFSNPLGEVFELMKSSGADIGMCAQSTGAVYFSGSAQSHEFMEDWMRATEYLVAHEEVYKIMDKKYKGLDQASIQLSKDMDDTSILSLPLKYHSTCHNYELPCHIMHYHSLMRAVSFRERDLTELRPELREYALAWRKYDGIQ